MSSGTASAGRPIPDPLSRGQCLQSSSYPVSTRLGQRFRRSFYLRSALPGTAPAAPVLCSRKAGEASEIDDREGEARRAAAGVEKGDKPG